jgi:hypothetical protein
VQRRLRRACSTTTAAHATGTAAAATMRSSLQPECSACMCADTGSTARGLQGVSRQQWELGSFGVVLVHCNLSAVRVCVVLRVGRRQLHHVPVAAKLVRTSPCGLFQPSKC